MPRTCEDFGATCGTIPDGCGSDIPCGTCGQNAICNANQCQAIQCLVQLEERFRQPSHLLGSLQSSLDGFTILGG